MSRLQVCALVFAVLSVDHGGLALPLAAVLCLGLDLLPDRPSRDRRP